MSRFGQSVGPTGGLRQMAKKQSRGVEQVKPDHPAVQARAEKVRQRLASELGKHVMREVFKSQPLDFDVFMKPADLTALRNTNEFAGKTDLQITQALTRQMKRGLQSIRVR